jgi:hypothetical protein
MWYVPMDCRPYCRTRSVMHEGAQYFQARDDGSAPLTADDLKSSSVPRLDFSERVHVPIRPIKKACAL